MVVMTSPATRSCRSQDNSYWRNVTNPGSQRIKPVRLACFEGRAMRPGSLVWEDVNSLICSNRRDVSLEDGEAVSSSFLRQLPQHAKRAERVALGMLRIVWALHLRCRRLTRNWAKERASDALMCATSSSESFSLSRASARCRASSALASSILSD